MPIVGNVAEIWRYPVSGLQGEKLADTIVRTKGIPGDHAYVLRDESSKKVLDPKTYEFSWGESLGRPSMLELTSGLSGDPEGEHAVTVEASGRTVCTARSHGVDAPASAALGDGVELVAYPRILQSRLASGRVLHLLTTASLRAMKRAYPGGNFDVRRFRPNIVIMTDDELAGFVEDSWVGRDLELGGVRLRIGKPNARCNVTTMTQPGLDEDPLILQTVQKENSGNLGVMCSVLVTGRLSVGDPVSISSKTASKAAPVPM